MQLQQYKKEFQNMLYAQINRKTNQMANQPVELPNRWTTSKGATINHFRKLPAEALQALDWLPVIYEELIDGSTHNHQPIYDEMNQQFVYEAIPRDIDMLISESERRIDEAASFASQRHISQGIGQEYRYMLKREQAIDFLNDPKPDKVTFPMIFCEAKETNRTPKETAELIFNATNSWMKTAAEIEALRCGSKKKCREATEVAEVIKFRDTAISALELI